MQICATSARQPATSGELLQLQIFSSLYSVLRKEFSLCLHWNILSNTRLY